MPAGGMPAEQPEMGGEMGMAPAPSLANPNAPVAAWGQCGGTVASGEAMTNYSGNIGCEDGSTCVYISSTFSQCIPVQQSRGYGCSALYAQCGGNDAGTSNAWSGPYCCGARRDGGTACDTAAPF